jgi:hypothetical protein
VNYAHRVISIDPLDGTIVQLSMSGDYKLRDVAITPDGAIFVSRAGDRVSHLDRTSGLYSMVSGSAVGAGPAFVDAGRLIALSDQALLMLDDAEGVAPRLVEVDVATGDRSVVSGAGTGAGPELWKAHDLGFESSTSARVVNGDGTLLQVDLGSGDRTVLLDPNVGAGPRPDVGWLSIAARAGEPMLAAGNTSAGESAVYRIDPRTGDRTALSGDDLGAGPPLRSLRWHGDSCREATRSGLRSCPMRAGR